MRQDKNIVTRLPIARQLVGNHIPETQKHSTTDERPILGNGGGNTHSRQWKMMFSVGSMQSGYKKCSAVHSVITPISDSVSNENNSGDTRYWLYLVIW
jgi:hypothetical protein